MENTKDIMCSIVSRSRSTEAINDGY